MQSTQQSMQPLALLKREIFPFATPTEFDDLWRRHGDEVRGKPFDLDHARYRQIQKQGRLVWIVARNDYGLPVGYSCHYWYRDIHFDDKVATDDMWFVTPSIRGYGIGRQLKELGHAELKKQGVVRIYDLIRESAHARLLQDLGFRTWGIRWCKDL